MDLWSVDASQVVVIENCRPLILNEFTYQKEKIFLWIKKEKKRTSIGIYAKLGRRLQKQIIVYLLRCKDLAPKMQRVKYLLKLAPCTLV